MAPKRKISEQQLEILLDYVEQNPDIAFGRHPAMPGYLGVQRARKMWDTWALNLNCVAEGATKTGEQWKRYWIEYKAKVRSKAADSRRSQTLNQTGGGPSQLTPLSPIEERVMALVANAVVEGMPNVRIPLSIEDRESKLKKFRQDNFTIVKKCCVNLVKNHGRSVTLFDDLAFRELMDLIPMTKSEKQILTSQYIQRLLDVDQLVDQTDMETTIDRTTDKIAADDESDIPLPLKVIKCEVEAIMCTCGKDNDESMLRHNVGCPASGHQTYCNFFMVSLDTATCQICSDTIAWTNMSTLKEHLRNSHPSVDFVDDEEEFQKGPPSEDGSTNDCDMEEVYLDEIVSENEQTASAAKRRRKRANAALHITGPITRENIAASLQRFESLDSFGQYVASLLKLIPKDKCIKFQIQMVERLLQEQAAAG